LGVVTVKDGEVVKVKRKLDSAIAREQPQGSIAQGFLGMGT
jgi:hypothetical protein